MLLLFQEGQRIPLTQTHILQSGDTDDDNPIVNAITDFLQAQNHGSRYAAAICFIDEDITVYEKETGKRVARLYTATMLEDWLRKYFNGEKVAPFTIKVYHQRNDNDEIEDERLWVGILQEIDDFNPSSLEKLYGLITKTHISEAYHGAILKSVSNICQDYCGECPITNVLTEMTQHLSLEFCVEGEQVDFYQENKRLDFVLPFTEQLKDWVTRFEKGEQVNEGVIYINRDDTLPDQPLFIGIDYDIENYNLIDFDRLDGMERRVTRQHIDDSQRGDCQHCVIANVLSELFRFYEINVNGSEAVIHTHGTEHAALLISERLGKWIDAYDNDGDVGTFTLIIKNLEGNEYRNYLLDIKDLTDRQKDLQNRISKLSRLSAEIEMECYYSDRDEDKIHNLEREYQDLFTQTVYEFRN